MPYNTANNNLLLALQECTLEDGLPRFVTMGSVARATLLDLPVNAFDDGNPARLQDIDVIDRLGIITNKIHFIDGSILDGNITRFFKPTPFSLGSWRLEDPRGTTGHCHIADVEHLGLGVYSMRENPAKIFTLDVLGMLAFQTASNYLHSQQWRKHQRQVQALSEIALSLSISAERKQALEHLTTSAASIKREQVLDTYSKFRACFFSTFPNVAQ